MKWTTKKVGSQERLDHQKGDMSFLACLVFLMLVFHMTRVLGTSPTPMSSPDNPKGRIHPGHLQACHSGEGEDQNKGNKKGWTTKLALRFGLAFALELVMGHLLLVPLYMYRFFACASKQQPSRRHCSILRPSIHATTMSCGPTSFSSTVLSRLRSLACC